MREKKIAAMFFTRGSYRECKGHGCIGKRGLMPALLATAPRARRAFTEQRYTGNAICRDATYYFFFFLSFLFCLLRCLYLFFTKASHAVRSTASCASTYKNFICLAYAIISMLVYYIFPSRRMLRFSSTIMQMYALVDNMIYRKWYIAIPANMIFLSTAFRILH